MNRVIRIAVIAGSLAFAFHADAQAANGVGDGRLQIAELGQCKLENSQVIEDCRVGYRTFVLC